MGPNGAEEKSVKQEGRVQSTTFERMTAQGHNVNRLKSIGSKMTSQIQVNLNPQSVAKRHTQRWQDSSKALSEDRGVGGSPMAGKILPLISI